jgi:hypothetical protein
MRTAWLLLDPFCQRLAAASPWQSCAISLTEGEQSDDGSEGQWSTNAW